MVNQNEFFQKYNINKEVFCNANIEWDDLMKIYENYIQLKQELEPAANLISECLRKINKVHSIKQRIKEPEHLIEKIIRKKLKDPDLQITVENYTERITDLIGVRALHLFKEDWQDIHSYITNTWDLVEKPKANVREGDAGILIDTFRDQGCDIVNHPFGYRSIHYLINVKPFKMTYIAEIQVRTIFEEGWSEIDHNIRYPYDINNPILANYLVMFNRLAGSADEMGSFVNFLSYELKKINDLHDNELKEKNRIIDELKITINELKIENVEKEKLQRKVASLEKKISENNYYTITVNSNHDKCLNSTINANNGLYANIPISLDSINSKINSCSNTDIISMNSNSILENTTSSLNKIISRSVLGKIEN